MKLGEYILERVLQLGAEHVFGVPGDYNMPFLDQIEEHSKLQWVGCANELNAAYAADGYARATGRISALVTAFGVGELSALNGVAGAYSERIPVVHLVGMPASRKQENHVLLHHTIGTHQYRAYRDMSSNISKEAVILGWGKRDLQKAAETIDHVLVSMITSMLPVYIGIPIDLVGIEIDSSDLHTPLRRIELHPPQEAIEEAVNDICRHVRESKKPVLLIDACVSRYHVTELIYELAKGVGIPVMTTPMGKGLYPEDDDQFLGLYMGSISNEAVRHVMDQCDLLIRAGSMYTDMNTGGFSYTMPDCHMIDLHSSHLQIGYAMYPDVGFDQLLPVLTRAMPRISPEWLNYAKKVEQDVIKTQPEPPKSEVLTHSQLWQSVGSILRRDDRIVVDTGTSLIGSLDVKLPAKVNMFSQMLYGSIGWSVGSALGVDFAGDVLKKGRTFLFVGDGSLLMTIQEIATMIRYGRKPIVFVLNNDGYEIERQIHGPSRRYNNIAPVDHSLLLSCLGLSHNNRVDIDKLLNDDIRSEQTASHSHDKVVSKRYYPVRTQADLDKLFSDDDFLNSDEMCLVELFLLRGDAPLKLKDLCRAMAAQSSPETVK